MNRFKLVAELEPEQKAVLNVCTRLNSSNEFILVQGVAGSGKTTIALHVLDKLGEIAASQPLDTRPTFLFLTYNRKLAESCANTLKDRPAFAMAQLLSQTGELKRGHVNILTFHDLCKRISADKTDKICEDQDFIKKINSIARDRGVHDLLPSQIFSLITTFLRGRTELLELNYEQLNQRIEEEIQRSMGYRMYGDSIRKVYRFVLRDYEDWKQQNKFLDRSDIAWNLHLMLISSETYLNRFNTMTAKQIKSVLHGKLGDQDREIGDVMKWLGEVMEGMQSSPIASQATQYREWLEKPHINQNKLAQLRSDLWRWIHDYGLRGTPVWEALGQHLINPVIVVDEFQDLSAIESEALIGLWFQLQRGRNSRLILFGDLNQQMNPVGFEWSQILDFLSKRATLYNYSNANNYFSQGFAEDYDDDRPFRLLNNNYRTTEEIACFVHRMIENVARHSLEEDVARRYLKHTIDPDRTVPYNVAAKIESMSPSERLPRILIGGHQTFLDALHRYIAQTQTEGAGDAPDPVDELLTTVIITEHPEVIEGFVKSEETGSASSRLSYIPTLSCKGLEFDSCILFGISIKETDRLEADILSRWYTSFTRARIRLLVYLSPKEYEYLQRVGWTDIEDNVAWVRHNPDVDTVFSALKWVGTTELDEEGHKVVGEISLARFFSSHDERWLRESLKHYELGGWQEERAKAAFQGAEYFEKQEEYLKAAEYYEIARCPVEQVRCLEVTRRQLLRRGDGGENVTKIRNRIENVIANVPEKDPFTRARCYLEIEEWEKALSYARQAAQDEGTQIADGVRNAIRKQLQSGITTIPIRLPEMLERYGFPDQACLAGVEVGNWKQALRCARKASSPIQDRIVRMAVGQIKNGQLPSEVRRSIAEELEKHEYWREAADGFVALEDRQSALRCLVQIPDFSTARGLLERANESERLACMHILAEAYERRGKETWPEAFYCYHEAGETEKADRILRRCRDNREYALLTQCYMKIGDKNAARMVANERQIQDGYREAEVAAVCWSMIGDWEDAARCWMQAYYRDLEMCEMLLGPNPQTATVHPATFRRCFDHMEKRREAYGISPERWTQMMQQTHASEEQARRAAESIVAIAAQSKAWREDVQTFYKRLDESGRRFGLASPAQGSLPRLLSTDRQLSAKEIAQLWEDCRERFDVFRKKAEEIADNLYQSGENRLLALRLLHHVCRNRKRSQELAEKLSKGDDESRRLWVQSWRILEISEEDVEKRLQDLDPVSDSALIRYAIEDYYQEKPARRKEAFTRYCQRLEKSSHSEAKRLLHEICATETKLHPVTPTTPDLVQDIHRELITLLEELSRRASDRLDEEDREDFQKQIRLILENPTETDRLQKRWNKAKACLSFEIQEIEEIVTRIEQLVEKLSDSRHTRAPSKGE